MTCGLYCKSSSVTLLEGASSFLFLVGAYDNPSINFYFKDLHYSK